MGKSSGKVDTSGLERATDKATALQEMIYNQSREDMQPWYQVGSAGISRLSDLLGLQGGSVQSREQIYQDLLPQYTTTQTIGGGAQSNFVVTPDGTILDLSNEQALQQYGGWREGIDDPLQGQMQQIWNPESFQDMGGFKRMSPAATASDVTDYEALNAAVDAQLAGQGTPDDYGSLMETFDMSKFEQDAGYQFRQDEARKALERQMAAQGVTLGGGGYGEINPTAARLLEEQSQGLASQEYGNAYNRYVGDQLNKFNMLMGVSGMGAGMTGQMQQAGQSYAGNVGQLTTDLASAQLNAQMANQSQPSMFSSLLGTGAQLAGAYFSDVRLKENIEHVGMEKGHNIYEFNYKDGSGRFRGVMADEVEKIEPDAVTIHSNGYKMVNYDKIGLQMERV